MTGKGQDECGYDTPCDLLRDAMVRLDDRAQRLVESEARERELETERDAAREEAAKYAQISGALEGEREAASWPGVLDGWKARTEKAEAREAVLVEALKDIARLAAKALTEPLPKFAETNVGEIHRVALAGVVEAEPREDFKKRLAKAVEENREALDLLAADDEAEPDGSERA